MIETFKIINRYYDIDPGKFFTQVNDNITRGHTKKIKKPAARTNLRQNSFTHRVVAPWNSLPEVAVSAPTVNSFKNRLDKHWAEHPVKYDWDANANAFPTHANRI